MLNYIKFIEILISLQSIFLSTMIPVLISVPFTDKLDISSELPVTWQIPTIILITIIFTKKVVISAYSIYLFLGLFFIPIFNQGGSLGYLLTPNFGYLIGIYPLINIIGNINKKNRFKFLYFILSGVIAIIALHLTGIIYNLLQLLYYRQINVFFYNLGYYSLGKIGYHFLMLFPLLLLIKPIEFLKRSK